MKDGAFAYSGLTRLLHERARLSLMTALSTAEEGRTFIELRRLCELTDGNLHQHLDRLEEAKLVSVKRRGDGRTAESRIRLTATGRKTFLRYLEELERVLRDARTAGASEGAGDEGASEAAPA
jgi:DNA-binding MarR family transcriptional regulator